MRVLLLIVLLVLAGCVQQQVVEVAEPAQAPVEVPVPTIPEPVEVVTPQSAQEPAMTKEQKKIAQLQSNALNKVKSYKYIYRDPRYDRSIVFPFDGQYFVKGNIVKVTILTPDEEISARQANVHASDTVLYKRQLYGEDYFDTIHFDTAEKTAVGTCEDIVYCPIEDKKIRLNYDEMYRKTPLDWTREIDPPNAKIVEEKMMQNRFIVKVQYLKNGNTVLLWIEEFSGLPIEADYVLKDGTPAVVKFENLAVNTVVDKDLMMPIN